VSGLGRNDKNYRQKTWQEIYGAVAGATTAVAYVMEGIGITAATWNPSVPRACRLSAGSITSQSGGDTVKGDWTLSFFINESATASATATFPGTTTLQGTVLDWDSTVLMQPGDRWYISAAGPERNTLITRVTLEFEIL
jgi:hypothetical protein